MKILKDQKFSTTSSPPFFKHHEFVALRTEENDFNFWSCAHGKWNKKAHYLYMNAGEKRVRILSFTNLFNVIFVNKRSTQIV